MTISSSVQKIRENNQTSSRLIAANRAGKLTLLSVTLLTMLLSSCSFEEQVEKRDVRSHSEDSNGILVTSQLATVDASLMLAAQMSFSTSLTCDGLNAQISATGEYKIAEGSQNCLVELVSLSLGSRNFTLKKPFNSLAVGGTAPFEDQKGKVITVRVLKQLPAVIDGPVTAAFEFSSTRRFGDIMVNIEAPQAMNQGSTIGIDGSLAPAMSIKSAKLSESNELDLYFECVTPVTGLNFESGTCSEKSMNSLQLAFVSFPSEEIDEQTLIEISKNPIWKATDGATFIKPSEAGLTNGGLKVTLDSTVTSISKATGGNFLSVLSAKDEFSFTYQKVTIEAATPTPAPEPQPEPVPMPKPSSSSEVEGYASMNAYGQNGTTGGKGGEVVTATNLTQLVNYITQPVPLIIQVSGTITGKGKYFPSSDKTIIGLGKTATIAGQVRLILDNTHNIIFKNIHFATNADGIAADNAYDSLAINNGSHHIWIDHCSFTGSGDGLIDVADSDYVTISWNYFYDHYKSFLWYGPETSPKVTFHHNYLKNLDYRTPQCRDDARCHLYNNFFDGHKSDAVRVRTDSLALVENNYMKNVEEPFREDGGTIKEVGNIYVNSGNVNTSGLGFTPPYAYKLDDAKDLPTLLPGMTGPQ